MIKVIIVQSFFITEHDQCSAICWIGLDWPNSMLIGYVVWAFVKNPWSFALFNPILPMF